MRNKINETTVEDSEVARLTVENQQLKQLVDRQQAEIEALRAELRQMKGNHLRVV